MLHNLFVVNKAGGLIFHISFSSKTQLAGNDTLRLASTFHSLHAIASQVSPVPHSGGIEVLQTDSVTVQCFQTLTGIKFFLTSDIDDKNLDHFLRKVYELYADYVLKNPFYELDQVIKCDLFESHLTQLASDFRF